MQSVPKNSTKFKIYILVSPAMQERPLYTSWTKDCTYPCVYVKQSPLSWTPPSDAGLIVSHMHFAFEYANKLFQIYKENQIPVLILMDGILEYKNIWLNALTADGSAYQPVFGHKVACIGASQARFIESWGNQGKCEIVGLPHLDQLREQGRSKKRKPINEYRILIASANRPFFNTEQENAVVQAYRDLVGVESSGFKFRGKPVEFIWRLSKNLAEQLSLPMRNFRRQPLWKDLDEVDAVITSPSTLFIESVLYGIPTAMIDYLNLPKYILSPWNINHKTQIRSIIRELLNPPIPKLQYQEIVLQDDYQMINPASQRLNELVESMISCRQTSVEESQPLRIPFQILDNSSGQAPENSFSPRLYYPENDSFQKDDLAELQSQLSMAIHRLGTIPEEINRLRQNNYKLAKQIRTLQKKLKH